MLIHRVAHIEKRKQKHNNLLMQHQNLHMQNNININQLALQTQIFEQEIQNLQKESQNEAIIHNSNALRKNKELQFFEKKHTKEIKLTKYHIYC